MSKIEGKVKNYDGQALSGIRIHLKEIWFGSVVSEKDAYTDINGYYYFDALPDYREHKIKAIDDTGTYYPSGEYTVWTQYPYSVVNQSFTLRRVDEPEDPTVTLTDDIQAWLNANWIYIVVGVILLSVLIFILWWRK